MMQSSNDEEHNRLRNLWISSHTKPTSEPAADEPDTAEQTAKDLANPEWLGECGWCGEEVNIFAHTNCPNFPK